MNFSVVGIRTVRYAKLSPKVVNSRDVARNAKEEEEEEIPRYFQSLALKNRRVMWYDSLLVFQQYVKR